MQSIVADLQGRSVSQIASRQSRSVCRVSCHLRDQKDAQVLTGIQEADWQRIKHVVVEVHTEELRRRVQEQLVKHYHEVVTEQDARMQGSQLCIVRALQRRTPCNKP
jgi:hypothetical protein